MPTRQTLRETLLIFLQTRPEILLSPLKKLQFLILAAAGMALNACTERAPDLDGQLIVLRHADRTFAPLNDKGVARASQLPAALEGIEIDAIYATDRGRNIATATPLAQERGLDVTVLPAIGAGTKILTDNPGKTSVWVGNQENLGFLFMELGIDAKPPVQFGDVYLLDIEPGREPSVRKGYYGDCPVPMGRETNFALASATPAKPAEPCVGTAPTQNG